MPIISAKCTNCGANLKVDNTKDAAVCPYCNTAYVVEKAVRNYNITNQITADTVNVYGGNSADFIIRAGTLEKYNGASTDVIIPNSVTIIGRQAFKGCSGLISVVIPDSVKEIGDDWIGGVFDGCVGLSNVVIPSSVTSIGDSAFRGCTGLKNMVLPSSVISIGDCAFQDCTGLSNLVLPDSLTSIGVQAFKGCTGLSNVVLSNSLAVISDYSFADCTRLTSIAIPSSVNRIGLGAFQGCIRLESITIPDSVIYVDEFDYGNDKLVINASLEWKTKHHNCHKSLYSYQPVSQNNNTGCYIATAVYGSYDCPQVWTLRRFRDDTLAATGYGRAFIRMYYAISPMLVKWFGQTSWFRNMLKPGLDLLVQRLNSKGIANTLYNDRQW